MKRFSTSSAVAVDVVVTDVFLFDDSQTSEVILAEVLVHAGDADSVLASAQSPPAQRTPEVTSINHKFQFSVQGKDLRLKLQLWSIAGTPGDRRLLGYNVICLPRRDHDKAPVSADYALLGPTGCGITGKVQLCLSCRSGSSGGAGVFGRVFSAALRPKSQKALSGRTPEAQAEQARVSNETDRQDIAQLSELSLGKRQESGHQMPADGGTLNPALPAASVGAAPSEAFPSSMMEGEPEALALWRTPEDSAQVALSPPLRPCWNPVLNSALSGGSGVLSPGSDNGSVRSHSSAEEVSSSQRRIEDAEQEQREAAAAAAAAAQREAVVASSGVQGPCFPRGRNLDFSGPLMFAKPDLKGVPATHAEGLMPLPEGLSLDAAFGTNSTMQKPEARGRRLGKVDDFLAVQGMGPAVQEEVEDSEGPSHDTVSGRQGASAAWRRHIRQELALQPSFREAQAMLNTDGWSPSKCPRAHSEELRMVMRKEEDAERPEDVYLSGPLIPGPVPWGSSQLPALPVQAQVDVSAPLEDSGSGTRFEGQGLGAALRTQSTLQRKDCRPSIPFPQELSATRVVRASQEASAPSAALRPKSTASPKWGARFSEMEWETHESPWELAEPMVAVPQYSGLTAQHEAPAQAAGRRFSSSAFSPADKSAGPLQGMELGRSSQPSTPLGARFSQPLAGTGDLEGAEEEHPCSRSAPLGKHEVAYHDPMDADPLLAVSPVGSPDFAMFPREFLFGEKAQQNVYGNGQGWGPH